jgi:hypothetical protein
MSETIGQWWEQEEPPRTAYEDAVEQMHVDQVARHRCYREFEGYPHPGCAEFGPPDVWMCPQYGPFTLTVSSDGPDGRESEDVFACYEHAVETLAYDDDDDWFHTTATLKEMQL